MATLVTFVQGYLLSIVIYIQVTSTISKGAYPDCMKNPELGIEKIQGRDDCVFVCPTVKDPVCGSDRHEYMNECFLCRAACMTPKRELSKRCDGLCPCEDDEEMQKWKKTHIKAHEDAQTHKDEGWAKHEENFPDHYKSSDEL